MKISRIIAVAIILLLISTTAFANPKGHFPHQKGEIVKQYRTLEMLKVLDLSEEESEGVLPILKEIEKNRETFHFERKQTINEIEFAIKQENIKGLEALNDKLLEMHKNFEKEREKLYQKLRSHLTEEQFAKFIVFNRSFGEQLHEKILKMREKFQSGH
ncbi:MAG: hypothetical protein H8D22_00055 [Candidatus Cloacimonetes bacterium]|nr:hypothetical protein [Candidatus Cloacimonadota bacterium]